MRRFSQFLLIGVAYIGCTPMDTFQGETIEYAVTNRTTAEASSSLTKFDPMMEKFEGIFSLLIDKKLTSRIAAIAYPTVDPNGEPVTASGLVYHPLNKKSKGVIDFMPMAHLNRAGGTSDDLFVTEGMLALLGYTIIIPDQIGYGISKDKMAPFLMAQNTGRVAYDMHCAAAQYLWDEFRYVASETVILGYSLGGSAALAAQRCYEAHQIKVKEVHAGGGPYDLPVAFAGYAKSGVSGYPAIPLAIMAFDYYYKLNLDFSQIFTGALWEDNHYQTWLHGEYTAKELKEMIGTDLHAYLHEDFFKPLEQQNSEFKKVYPYLAENSVTDGWRPKAPIYLSHSSEDIIVPKDCAEVALKKLRKAGGQVSLFIYPGDHYTVGYLFYIRSVLHNL